MRIYISGSISGQEGYQEKFEKAENALTAAGHSVCNPAKLHLVLPENATHAEYMRLSVCMLDMCEAVFMLQGWEQSAGANTEITYAAKRGHTIFFEGGRGCQSTQDCCSSALQ